MRSCQPPATPVVYGALKRFRAGFVAVIITPREGQLSVKLGGQEWVDTAVSAGIGLLVLPPVFFGTVWGIWKEHSLEDSVWRVIDERMKAAGVGEADLPVTRRNSLTTVDRSSERALQVGEVAQPRPMVGVPGTDPHRLPGPMVETPRFPGRTGAGASWAIFAPRAELRLQLA